MSYKITVEVDALDRDAILAAIAARQSVRVLPDSESEDLRGRLLAEVCRGYLDYVYVPPEL